MPLISALFLLQEEKIIQCTSFYCNCYSVCSFSSSCKFNVERHEKRKKTSKMLLNRNSSSYLWNNIPFHLRYLFNNQCNMLKINILAMQEQVRRKSHIPMTIHFQMNPPLEGKIPFIFFWKWYWTWWSPRIYNSWKSWKYWSCQKPNWVLLVLTKAHHCFICLIKSPTGF